MAKNYSKIGMVVAMEKEVKPFLEKCGSVIQKEVFGYTVFECETNGKRVYLIKSGIGEIYAAGATQVLISVYKCDLILNFGVCGSLTDDIAVCETVVISGVVHYDFDLSRIDDVKVGQYPDYDVIIKTDEELTGLALSVSKDVKPAVCASADKFVDGDELKERLRAEFSADVCDMESAGVLLTALNAKIPCLIIKAVSDGKGGADEFSRRVFEASKVYLDTLANILERV